MIDDMLIFLECWNKLPPRVNGVLADCIRQISKMHPDDLRQLDDFLLKLDQTNSHAGAFLMIQWQELLRSRRWQEGMEREWAEFQRAQDGIGETIEHEESQ